MWNLQLSRDATASCYLIILAASLFLMLKSKIYFLKSKRSRIFRKNERIFHFLDQFVLNNRWIDMRNGYIYAYLWVFSFIFFKKKIPSTLYYIKSMAHFLAKGLSMNHFTYGFISDWIANHSQNLLMSITSAIFRDIMGRVVLVGRCIAAE